jgi:hypothetical protein
MRRELIETTWGHFSERFVSHHDLPYGTELRLFDSKGKKKRTDLKVRRRRITSTSIARASDSDNVRSLVEAAINLMSTDLRARKLSVKLFGPDGRAIDGHKLIKNVRALPARPTEEDRERQDGEQALLAERQDAAYTSIRELEYQVDDPSKIVCGAVVNALVERYGRSAVIAAIGK